MNNEKREAMEELTQNVRKAYDIGIPFSDNIEEVLEKMGGKLERIEPDGWCQSKLYLRTKIWESKFTIRVSPSLRRESQDYEIAAQIGHLFLHTTFVDTMKDDTKALLFREDVSQPKFGLEANEFANALIMPRAEFIQEVHKNTENGRVKISNVREKFGVTYEIAMVRARALKLIQ